MAESGVVQDITTRDVSGGRKAYNIVVGGQSFGAGLFAPKCKVGDYVTFELEERNGFKNVAPRSLKVGKAPPSDSGSSAGKAVASGNSSFDKRQDAISRQAASNTAIAFMQLLASQDALPIPVSKNKGDKQEIMETLLRGYEIHFYEANTGNVWTDIAPTPKEAPATDGSDPEQPLVDDEPWS